MTFRYRFSHGGYNETYCAQSLGCCNQALKEAVQAPFQVYQGFGSDLTFGHGYFGAETNPESAPNKGSSVFFRY